MLCGALQGGVNRDVKRPAFWGDIREEPQEYRRACGVTTITDGVEPLFTHESEDDVIRTIVFTTAVHEGDNSPLGSDQWGSDRWGSGR